MEELSLKQKIQNIKQAIADYFDDDVENIATFVIGADRKTGEDGTLTFSSVYSGLTSNWAIGNLRAIERHIEQEQNRAAMNQTMRELEMQATGEPPDDSV
jgi:hypothetical protein